MGKRNTSYARSQYASLRFRNNDEVTKETEVNKNPMQKAPSYLLWCHRVYRALVPPTYPDLWRHLHTGWRLTEPPLGLGSRISGGGGAAVEAVQHPARVGVLLVAVEEEGVVRQASLSYVTTALMQEVCAER